MSHGRKYDEAEGYVHAKNNDLVQSVNSDSYRLGQVRSGIHARLETYILILLIYIILTLVVYYRSILFS